MTSATPSLLSSGILAQTLDFMALLARRKRLILGLTTLSAVASSITVLLLPQRFESNMTLITTPSEEGGGMGALSSLAGKELGGLLGSKLGGQNSSVPLLTTLLQSREFSLAMVRQFRLDTVWSSRLSKAPPHAEDLVKQWNRNFGIMFTEEDALILSFTDRSPRRSQQVLTAASRWVDSAFQSVYHARTVRSLEFLERHRSERQRLLDQAEDSLIRFQIRHRNFVPDEQLRQSIVNAARMEVELQKISLQTELERTTSGSSSSTVKVLESQQSSLKQRLSTALGENTKATPSIIKGLSPAIQEALQYERLRRGAEIHGTVLKYLIQETEQLRLEAQKSTPVLTVLDPALLPGKRKSPPRRVIVQFVVTLTFLASCTAVAIQDALRRAANPRLAEAWKAFRSSLLKF